MADNKIQLPSSGGGLLRYSDEIKSNIVLSPYSVVFLIVAAIIGLALLHYLF